MLVDLGKLPVFKVKVGKGSGTILNLFRPADARSNTCKICSIGIHSAKARRMVRLDENQMDIPFRDHPSVTCISC
jgi:hypothetical protein